MSGQWHGGKGSKPRPLEISSAQFDENWDRAVSKQPTLREQYDNYVACSQDLNQPIKTFQEWLHS